MNKAQINETIQQARKSAQPERVQAFQALLAAIQAEEGRGRSMEEIDIVALAKKEYNQFKESAQAFDAALRSKAAAEMQACADHLEELLPQEIAEDWYPMLVEEAIVETNARGLRDMGKVMALVKKNHGLSIDMKKISVIVKAKLEKYYAMDQNK